MPHQPDFENLRRTILRQDPPGPVPLFELFADPGLVEAVLGETFPVNLHKYVEESLTDIPADEIQGLMKSMEMYVRFCREVGYDYVFMATGFSLKRNLVAVTDTAGSKNWANNQRYWQNEDEGPIRSWADFEAYPWPKPDGLDHTGLEFVSQILPEGMKAAAFTYGGVFENATWLMGLVPFSYALQDQPDLVEAICNRVGELATATATQAAAIDNVGMVLLSDDLGFSTGPLVSPDVLRRYVFPHYKKIVEAVHDAGKLLVFHSCGNIFKLMDDLIDDIGVDAKHSFEDKIMPIEEAYRTWGDRVSLLGGVDMDVLARGSVEQVRARCREILEVCGAGGKGFALGTGNTAANYIPCENYLAMVDECRRWNREHFGTE